MHCACRMKMSFVDIEPDIAFAGPEDGDLGSEKMVDRSRPVERFKGTEMRFLAGNRLRSYRSTRRRVVAR